MQHGCVFESYCTFHSVVKVKFLACVLNVTHRFVMHIISYASVVYFIVYVCSNCIVCNSECMVDTNVTL
jgi:hypothetical protein